MTYCNNCGSFHFDLKRPFWWEKEQVQSIWKVELLDFKIGPDLQYLLDLMENIKKWEAEEIERDWRRLNRISFQNIVTIS